MPVIEKKYKTLNYRRAAFSEPAQPLAALLAQALQARPTIGQRREQLAPDGESAIWRMVGNYSVKQGYVYGVLMRYMPGLYPQCLVDDELAKTIDTHQLKVPKTDDGKPRELIEGTLYFACFDNHVAMMQSAGLRSGHLEQHLQWLLRTTQLVADDNRLRLNDQPSASAEKALESTPVRGFAISGDLAPTEQSTPAVGPSGEAGSQAPAQAHTATSSFELLHGTGAGNGIWDTLTRLIGVDDAAKLNISALTGSNIEFSLNVRYSHTTTSDGQKLLNQVGAALRHAEEVDTVIQLEGGGSIRGDQLRLSEKIRIETFDGVPQTDTVWKELQEWLLQLVTTGAVPA